MVGKENESSFSAVIGEHPDGESMFSTTLNAEDMETESGTPHRSLSKNSQDNKKFIQSIRTLLVAHHISPEAAKRYAATKEAMKDLGHEQTYERMSRFPINENTQKGNLAEIVLAEYIAESGNLSIPIYRLRFNPNIDQAMKGDDVLAFDLDSEPVRILVGESKFRQKSSKAAVEDIVSGLLKSHQGGLPASLQFVADRLFEQQNFDLGQKVLNCSLHFVKGQLRLDYIGFLMSDKKTSEKIQEYKDGILHRLVMISLNLDNPNSIIEPCFDKLEEEL